MKHSHRSATQQAVDKNGKSIKPDDICRIEWSQNSILNGKSGKILAVTTDEQDRTIIELELSEGRKDGRRDWKVNRKPPRTIHIAATFLKRTKLAENTSEYRLPRISRRDQGNYKDALGQDQRNLAIYDALMRAIEEQKPEVK